MIVKATEAVRTASDSISTDFASCEGAHQRKPRLQPRFPVHMSLIL